MLDGLDDWTIVNMCDDYLKLLGTIHDCKEIAETINR